MRDDGNCSPFRRTLRTTNIQMHLFESKIQKTERMAEIPASEEEAIDVNNIRSR